MTEQTISKQSRLATLPALLTVSVFTRLIVNTATQLFNPFLPVIAAGLGTDVVMLGRLLGLRSAMGLFAPLFDTWAARWGYRRIMRLELLLTVAGLLLVGGSVRWWMTVLGMALLGLGISTFVPTLRTYLSFQLPYAQRARGFGILEYSWALSGIVGLFLMGKLIAVAGWRAPFVVLAVLVLLAWLIFGELPPTSQTTDPASKAKAAQTAGLGARLRAFFTLASNRLSAWSAIMAGALASYGTFHLFSVYGAWLSAEYGLQPSQLGTVALVLGCADLCGSVAVSLITDRIGKRRGTLIGLTGALLGFALLPLVNYTLLLTVAVLAVGRAFFEFGIVSHISLVSEQVPTQRGKVVTLSFTCGLVGNTLSSLSGPAAYLRYGAWGLGWVTAAAIALSLLLVVAWVKDVEV